MRKLKLVTRLAPIHTPFVGMTVMILLFMLVGCDAQTGSQAPPLQKATPVIVSTPSRVPVSPTFIPELATLAPFVCDEDWQSLPVIPEVPNAARILYEQGLAQGNNSRSFSKIGDGEISTDWFLTAFDLGESHYNLGDHQNLKAVIGTFHGSFERKSVAAQRGFNTNLILDVATSDPVLCRSGESPLDCELRIHTPSIAILSLGTNQVHRREEFEVGMRQIINVLISRKVLPILSTKGDNLEGNHAINRTIACLAQEYQIPLWNFWAAIQPLPNHGLQADLEHLTYYGINDFGDSHALKSAWTIRNLTALQILDAVWQRVK